MFIEHTVSIIQMKEYLVALEMDRLNRLSGSTHCRFEPSTLTFTKHVIHTEENLSLSLSLRQHPSCWPAFSDSPCCSGSLLMSRQASTLLSLAEDEANNKQQELFYFKKKSLCKCNMGRTQQQSALLDRGFVVGENNH